MVDIQLSRRFLKRPINSVAILLVMSLLLEAIAWQAAYNQKLLLVNRAGGIAGYAGLFIRNVFLPELVTVIILMALISVVHSWFGIRTVDTAWRSIRRYELRFLPVMLLAFLVFNPFTQSVRYLLTAYPVYSLADYWTKAIVSTYTWPIYLRYLMPVLVTGYGALNVSLLTDLLTQGKSPIRR